MVYDKELLFEDGTERINLVMKKSSYRNLEFPTYFKHSTFLFCVSPQVYLFVHWVFGLPSFDPQLGRL